MEIVRLEEAGSTNTWVAEHEEGLESPSLVYCFKQSAGRGQRGNTWESEPGKNITASLLFHPREFEAFSQFAISEAVALALTEVLRNEGVDAKVKWPNDIYVGDKKICGILVEHFVTGRHITRTIAGFGLNLNQTEFLSDAPNPVSLKILTGHDFPLEEMIEKVAETLEGYISKIDRPEELHEQFLERMWRNDGRYYKFRDRKQDETIMARIAGVSPMGMLSLETDGGETREYAFKEVEFIIGND